MDQCDPGVDTRLIDRTSTTTVLRLTQLNGVLVLFARMRGDALNVWMQSEGCCVLFAYLFNSFFSHVVDHVSVFGIRVTSVTMDRAICSSELDYNI